MKFSKIYNPKGICRDITGLGRWGKGDVEVFPELQEKHLADPKSGVCPCFKVGDTFLLKRTTEEREWLERQNIKNSVDDAYTG